MNLVDSCGWLEFFADGPNADFFAPAILDTEQLIVPSICVLEVFKVVLRQRGEDEALQVAALLHRGRVVDLSSSLSLSAARLGVDHQLPLADSVILATALEFNAEVLTQDADFKGLRNVRFVEKQQK